MYWFVQPWWPRYFLRPDRPRDILRSEGMYNSFSYHYQRSIDFNIVNIQPTIGMNILVFTGNSVDTKWYDFQELFYQIHSMLPRECTGKYCSRDSKSWYIRISGSHPRTGSIDNAPAKMQIGTMWTFAIFVISRYKWIIKWYEHWKLSSFKLTLDL